MAEKDAAGSKENIGINQSLRIDALNKISQFMIAEGEGRAILLFSAYEPKELSPAMTNCSSSFSFPRLMSRHKKSSHEIEFDIRFVEMLVCLRYLSTRGMLQLILL